MKLSFLCILILVYSPLFSQPTKLEWEYNFRNYSVRSGLPSSETYDVKQDNDGNVWIATDRGVVKYDGRNFVTFTKKDGLADNVVFQIYKDASGRMWFIGDKYELCYYHNGKIISYPFNDKIRQVTGAFEYPTKNIVVLDDGSVVYSLPVPGGCIVIDKDGNIKNIPQEGNTIEVIPFGKERIYSCKLNDRCGAALLYQETSNTKKIFIDSVLHNTARLLYAEDPQHKVLVAGDRLYELNTQKKLFEKGSRIIYAGFVDRLLAVGFLGKGISFYNIDNGEPQLVHSELQQHSVTNVLKDRQGSYWFSTLDAGVFYLRSFDVQGIRNGLLSNNIKQVYGLNDKIYVSFSGTQGYQVLSGNIAESKLQNAGNIMFSSVGADIIISNTSRPGIDAKETTRFYNWYRDIYSAGDHALLASEIVARTDDKGTVDTIYCHSRKNDLKNFQAVMEDEKGVIWLGTKNGLFVLSPRQQLILFQPGRFTFHVTDLLYHPQWGKLVATRDAGLFRVSGQSTQKIEGLLSDDITYLFCDKTGRLWVATGKGLNILTLQKNGTGKVNAITTAHGLYSDEITSVFVDDRFAWVGTKEGLSKINTAFRFSEENYKIRLNTFFIDSTPVDISKRITVPYSKDAITIDFGTTDFITKGQYKYHLNPGAEWIFTQDPKITLLNLKDGNYLLEAAFLDEENRWSPVQQIVRFEILPPFWKTWYFITAVVLFTGLLIALYLRYKKRQSDTRERLLVLEQNALFAQMNPHFIFNALNSITSFLLYEEYRKAEYYLGKFAKLLRETLQASRQTTVTIQTEVGMLKKYLELEKMRFSDQFTWNICCEIPEPYLNTRIPGMLIQPYVENAIKHGFEATAQHGKVDIRLSLIDSTRLKCEIEDNGIGRITAFERKKSDSHESGEHISYGEKITRERLETYNRKQRSGKGKYGISICDLEANGVPIGTKVELNIPLLTYDENWNM